jgi:hypothetical protein
MTTNDQSTFWRSIPPALRHTIELAVPAQKINDTICLSTQSTSLASKYSILETLLKDTAKQDGQITRPSNDQSSSNTPHISILFPLAMLQTEPHNYTAAV